MKRPRPFLKILQWSAVTAILVALIAAGIFTNITLRSVEKNLPNTLFEQLRHLDLILEKLAEVLADAELTKAVPGPANFMRLRQKVAAVQSEIVDLRNTYVLDNLIQASAFHSVVAPAIADVQLWLSEGVSGYGPETDTTIRIVLSRVLQTFQSARVLNQASRVAAQKILDEQRDRLDRFLSSVNLLFALALLITCVMVFLLFSQHMLQRREFEARAERRKAEEALRESEATLKSIFKASPIGIGLVRERVLQQVNERLCEMIGYSPDELIGQSARILYPSQEEFEWVGNEKYAQISERGTGTVETRWRRKDGAIRDILLSSTPLDANDLSVGVTFSALDITERKQAEVALSESQERFRELAELLPEIVFEMDVAGNLTFVNRNAFNHFGYSQEDLERGLNGFEMLIAEDRPRVMRNAERVMRGEAIGLNEYTAVRKDGSAFPVIMRSSAKYHEGMCVGLRGIVIDITQTKKLEAQLRQAHKMEAIGTLAGGIAHDFNNLLQAVQGYAELLLLDRKENEAGYKELHEINRAARRGSELTRQLLTFSRKVESNLRPTDLNRTVEHLRMLLERTIPKMIKIELHLTGNLYRINADASQIEQILMNLAVNARDAMHEGGKLVIETKNVILNEAHHLANPEVPSGKYVLLSVTDTGHGMDENTLENVFNPFFTTKEVGKGTGLGLAMVYGIVKSHFGHITCQSKPGEGTAFRIYLPALERQVEVQEIVEGAIELPRGHEVVLLVDDDDSVRDLAERILEKFGYRVIRATDGESALQIFRDEMKGIDLVLLDLIMPGMGGKQCLQKLLEIDPQVKIVVASGYSATEELESIMKIGAKAFIQKPYDVQQMLNVIREVLG